MKLKVFPLLAIMWIIAAAILVFVGEQDTALIAAIFSVTCAVLATTEN